MALGGWLPAAGRDIWFVPDGFSRAEQERGPASWRQQNQKNENRLGDKAFQKSIRDDYCAELILW
jgi:hypothetical protein